MPSKKREKKNLHQPFESMNPNGRFHKIVHDMTQSPAYQDLTMQQRQLYFQMKMKYFPEKSTRGVILPATDRNIVYSRQDWIKDYSKWQTFHNDLVALISHGFIDELENGKTTRTKNIYGLSERWKTWTNEKMASPDCTKGSDKVRTKRTKKEKTNGKLRTAGTSAKNRGSVENTDATVKKEVC